MFSPPVVRDVPLKVLREVGLSPGWASWLTEGAVVCFDLCQHGSGISVDASGCISGSFSFRWTSSDRGDRETLFASWNDHQEATEAGATGIALILMYTQMNLSVCRRSAKDGGGFDYYLAPPGHKAVLFQQTSRLEISGTLKDGRSEITQRVRKKSAQIKKSSHLGLPGYVVVVGFRDPAVESVSV